MSHILKFIRNSFLYIFIVFISLLFAQNEFELKLLKGIIVTIEGFWQSESNYILVIEDGSRIKKFSSIAILRESHWLYGTDKDFKINVLDKYKRNVATIVVEPDEYLFFDSIYLHYQNSEIEVFYTSRFQSYDFFDSMFSYSQLYFLAGVLYPDIILRLVILFIVSLVFFVILRAIHSKILYKYSGFFRALSLYTIKVLLIGFSAPFIIGYIWGSLQYIFFGWWDVKLTGQIIIISINFIIMLPLIYLVHYYSLKRNYLPINKNIFSNLISIILTVSGIIGLIHQIAMLYNFINTYL